MYLRLKQIIVNLVVYDNLCILEIKRLSGLMCIGNGPDTAGRSELAGKLLLKQTLGIIINGNSLRKSNIYAVELSHNYFNDHFEF